MSEDREIFRAWFVEVLEGLYDNPHAGFALLMIAFPLLERYVRGKSGTGQGDLHDPFYDELSKLFDKELPTRADAKAFWGVYRNGILHQVTLLEQTRKGAALPGSMMSQDFSGIGISPEEKILISPKDFAMRVIHIIHGDFDTFVGTSSGLAPLAQVQEVPSPAAEAECATYLRRDSISATLAQSRGPPAQYQTPPNAPQIPIFGTSVKPSKT